MKIDIAIMLAAIKNKRKLNFQFPLCNNTTNSSETPPKNGTAVANIP